MRGLRSCFAAGRLSSFLQRIHTITELSLPTRQTIALLRNQQAGITSHVNFQKPTSNHLADDDLPLCLGITSTGLAHPGLGGCSYGIYEPCRNVSFECSGVIDATTFATLPDASASDSLQTSFAKQLVHLFLRESFGTESPLSLLISCNENFSVEI